MELPRLNIEVLFQKLACRLLDFTGMHARLVLLHRRPARRKRKNPPLTDGTRKVTGWPPRQGCAGRQRRQRAACGLSSEKNAPGGEGMLGISLKRLSGLEQKLCSLSQKLNDFWKKLWSVPKKLSNVLQILMSLEKILIVF
jgi:hypothetical protein